MPTEPLPNLSIHAGGLTFPWAEAVDNESLSEAALGTGGVAMGFVMDIYWSDLEDAIQQLLGFSWRAVPPGSTGPGKLVRVLPFQHPYFNQLWCTRIARAKFRQSTGNETWVDRNAVGIVTGSGAISTWGYVRLILEFTRPPYNILGATSIVSGSGDVQEWRRYTDRFWKPSVEILSRPDGMFVYAEGTTTPKSQGVQGSVGQRLGKVRLDRTWYGLPEAAIYNEYGFPSQLFTINTSGVITPRLGTVNNNWFMGCAPGTLLYEIPEIIPQPLPMPAYLMMLGNGDAVPQLQYDVKFHFTYFDPPIGTANGATTRGHNCMPWAVDNRWYKVWSQVGHFTPFDTSDFTQLFTIL